MLIAQPYRSEDGFRETLVQPMIGADVGRFAPHIADSAPLREVSA